MREKEGRIGNHRQKWIKRLREDFGKFILTVREYKNE